MDLYTICERPSGAFVVKLRQLPLSPEPKVVAVAGTLEEARNAVPPGLYCQPGQEIDAPNVIETWF